MRAIPGAYMDRSVLEGNPHQIIEGMIIGAYGTGATEGIIYVRNEYPLAIKHLSDRPSPGRSSSGSWVKKFWGLRILLSYQPGQGGRGLCLR